MTEIWQFEKETFCCVIYVLALQIAISHNMDSVQLGPFRGSRLHIISMLCPRCGVVKESIFKRSFHFSLIADVITAT